MIKGEDIIFIAHSGHDKELALSIYESLKSNGYNPWIDKYDIALGEIWKNAIREAIESCSFFIICISRSLNKEKSYAHKELRIALEDLESRPPGAAFLLPIVLDRSPIPDLNVGSVKLSDFQALYLDSLYDLESLFAVLDRHIVKDQKNYNADSIGINLKVLSSKELINKMIKEDKTELALEKLEHLNLGIDAQNRIVLLSSQYNRIKREYLTGTIDSQSYRVLLNKINLAILDASSDLE